MLVSGERTKSVDGGRELAGELIADRAARCEKFSEVIALQGGDPRWWMSRSRLPQRAGAARTCWRDGDGFVASIRERERGRGEPLAGRRAREEEDAIDPAVGLGLQKKIGDAVDARASRCAPIHYNSETRLARGEADAGGEFRDGRRRRREAAVDAAK